MLTPPILPPPLFPIEKHLTQTTDFHFTPVQSVFSVFSRNFSSQGIWWKTKKHLLLNFVRIANNMSFSIVRPHNSTKFKKNHIVSGSLTRPLKQPFKRIYFEFHLKKKWKWADKKYFQNQLNSKKKWTWTDQKYFQNQLESKKSESDLLRNTSRIN